MIALENKIIIKRDGGAVSYDRTKISKAVMKALWATSEIPYGDTAGAAEAVTAMVEKDILTTSGKDGHIAVEDIQDMVEKNLMLYGLTDTAKAFILYREQRRKLRETQSALLDVTKQVDEFIGPNKDWHVKENASVTCTLGGLILSNSSAIIKKYWLNNIYDPDVAEAHKDGDFHIHDLGVLAGYCAGWSLKQLIQEGLGGVEGRVTSAPAAHLSTLCNQMVNFLGILQNEWAGAQALSSFDTYLAPFVRKDNLSYKQVKQCIQSFVFGANVPARWGCQPPFTNITLDWNVPDDLKDLPAIVGGKPQDFTYGDCKKEMDMVNKAFMEVMIEGDANGRGFQYPIPTYSITKDFDWSETENNKLLFEMAAKYGTPYFSNYVNSDMQPSDVRSMCCRLRLDLRELRRKSGGFFGSGESTGSIGVVTINLPRLGYLSKDKEDFYRRLDRLMDLAARSLDVKRKTVTQLMASGMYPYTQRYLGGFDNHFSTIGLVGMNEAAENAKWLRTNLTTPEGQEFAKEVLNHMRERLQDYQELYNGTLFNLEATPAESTTYRFAKKDVERYPDIITAAKHGEAPFYTNSSHIPVGFTDDVFEALDLQDELQPLYTSGTVFHAFLGERLPDWQSAAGLVKKITDNYHLPYITLSPTYSVCQEHGYIVGEHKTCPKCGRPTEIYSRITGYYRPLNAWNDGKASEFEHRKTYKPGAIKADAPVREVPKGKEPEPKTPEAAPLKKPLLVSTKTCPNCKMAATFLDEAGFPYEKVYAEDNMALMASFNIRSVPALLVPSEDGWVEVITGFGPIRAYAQGNPRG